MVFDKPPIDFAPIISVAACFIEHEGRILFLHRSENVSQPGTWAIPGGKVEKGETPEQAVCREIREECQFELKCPIFIQTVYIRYPNYDYVYHIFKEIIAIKPQITINYSESQSYDWLTREQMQALDAKNKLIPDEMPCIERVYGAVEKITAEEAKEAEEVRTMQDDIMPGVKVSVHDPKEFEISILKEEHINGTAEIFTRAFCDDEPLTHYLGISHDAFRPFAIQVAIKAAKDRLSIVACNSTGQVVGCAIAEDIIDAFNVADFAFMRPIAKFLEMLSEPFSDMHFKARSVMHLFVTAVSKEVRGLGLSTRLNNACISLALQNGFSYFAVEFTSEINERFMSRFKDHIQYAVCFKDFVLDGEKPFIQLEGRACCYISSAAPYILLKDISNVLLQPSKVVDHKLKPVTCDVVLSPEMINTLEKLFFFFKYQNAQRESVCEEMPAPKTYVFSAPKIETKEAMEEQNTNPFPCMDRRLIVYQGPPYRRVALPETKPIAKKGDGTGQHYI